MGSPSNIELWEGEVSDRDRVDRTESEHASGERETQ